MLTKPKLKNTRKLFVKPLKIERIAAHILAEILEDQHQHQDTIARSLS